MPYHLPTSDTSESSLTSLIVLIMIMIGLFYAIRGRDILCLFNLISASKDNVSAPPIIHPPDVPIYPSTSTSNQGKKHEHKLEATATFK